MDGDHEGAGGLGRLRGGGGVRKGPDAFGAGLSTLTYFRGGGEEGRGVGGIGWLGSRAIVACMPQIEAVERCWCAWERAGVRECQLGMHTAGLRGHGT